MELDDLSRPAIADHLREHLDDMRSVSPPESVHALDLDGLRAPNIRFWSAWIDDSLVGTVALKDLGAGDVEIKSMRTTAAARGRGVGRQMLAFALEQARTSGAARVVLETGAEPYFEPARGLYVAAGFSVRGPFADYVVDPNSVYMELALA
ncbi:N-acetyltransferase [Nocardioides baekrokdamisoli]|uniref:N-acetyltransferase n=2 Tax=Nocardioides baekrokdamisoli TaxID=1804624 RepID=A0A3G9ICD5_9ACTN|nr:N-acetyltransferase [Nocardioides baekrokdamisoli]